VREHQATDRPPVIYIATVVRATGETGVQTHCNGFMRFLEKRQRRALCVTPFSAPRGLVYPVLGLRRLIDPASGPLGVWWYRYWHGRLLEYALVRQLARAEGSVIIYAQCPVSASAALSARRDSGHRVVMASHFNISQADEWAHKGRIRTGGSLYRRIRQFEASTLPRLDGVVYVSQFARKELESRMPALQNVSSSVIPNFIDAPVVDGVKHIVGDLVNVGTLEPRKNQAYLIETVGAAARMGRRYTLTLIGDGPDRASLERLAHRLDVQTQVRFLGFRRDAARLIAGHRLYCHVSRMESFGVVLLESMARGVPVAAPAVGGIPEVFRAGVEGIFWPLESADETAHILIRCLEDEVSWRGWAPQVADECPRASLRTVSPRDCSSFCVGIDCWNPM